MAAQFADGIRTGVTYAMLGGGIALGAPTGQTQALGILDSGGRWEFNVPQASPPMVAKDKGIGFPNPWQNQLPDFVTSGIPVPSERRLPKPDHRETVVSSSSPRQLPFESRLEQTASASNRGLEAKGLLRIVDNVLSNWHQPAMAVYIQSLKSRLANVHGKFDRVRTETNFISLVSLAEATLASRTWGTYTQAVFQTLRDGFQVAYERPVLKFGDLDQLRKRLNKAGANTVPTFDLANASDQDVEYGFDEGEED